MEQTKIKKRCPECGSEEFLCKIIRIGVCNVFNDGQNDVMEITKEDNVNSVTIVKFCANEKCSHNKGEGLNINQLVSTANCTKCGKEYIQEDLNENGECPLCVASSREDLKDASKEDLIRMILKLEHHGNGVNPHAVEKIDAKLEKADEAMDVIEEKKQKADEKVAANAAAEAKKADILGKVDAAAATEKPKRPRQKKKDDTTTTPEPAVTENTPAQAAETPASTTNSGVTVTPVKPEEPVGQMTTATPVSPVQENTPEAPFPTIDTPNPPAMNPYTGQQTAEPFPMFGDTAPKNPGGAF